MAQIKAYDAVAESMDEETTSDIEMQYVSTQMTQEAR